jgi:tetratricopeptide (TPR) repeat protein
MSSADATGQWAVGLPAAVASIANRLTRRLQDSIPDERAPRPSGFSRSPEISWLFYRGIAHCLIDEPEWGAVYFLEALRVDPLFTAARIWNLRAFELLGFGEFAKLEHARLVQTLEGSEALRQWEHGDWLPRHALVIALLTPLHATEPTARIIAQLRQSLEQSPNIFLFDPDRIGALAAEMDLQRTARFGEPAEFTRLAWTAVHGVLSVESVDRRSGGNLRVRVHYRPTLIAQPTWTREIGTSASDIERVASELASQAQRSPRSIPAVQGGSVQDRGAREAPNWRRTPTDRMRTRADLAHTFSHLRAHPTDAEGWRNLPPFVEWLDRGHLVAVWTEQLVRLVDLNAPDASLALSGLLWQRHLQQSRIFPPSANQVSLAEEFEPLIRGFPDSLEADYVRVVQAIKLFEQNEFEEAARLFLELEPRLQTKAPTNLISPEYWACYYTYTAAALGESGRVDEARAWFVRADHLFRQHPTLIPYQRIDGFWARPEGNRLQPVWTNPFPARHDRIGPHPTLREAVQHALQEVPVPAPESLASLQAWFGQIEAFSGADRISYHRDRVVALIDYKDQHRQALTSQTVYGTGSGALTVEEKLFLEAASSLNQLVSGTLVQDDFRTIQELGRQLAQGVHPSLAALSLEAVGLYHDARLLLERHLTELDTQSVPVDRNSRIGWEAFRISTIAHLARLWHLMGQPDRAGDLLSRELASVSFSTLSIAAQIAQYWLAAGRSDDACALYRRLAGNPPPNNLIQNPGAIARLRLAECEMARGQFFEATEILRGLAQECDGTNWVTSGGRFLLLKDEVLDRLAIARNLAHIPMQSRDWAPRIRSTYAQVLPAPMFPDNPAVRDLQDLLLGEILRLPGMPADSPDPFVQRYGRDAMPAVWRAVDLSNLSTPRRFLGPQLLDRLAEPEDAPRVLELFKREPWIARTAFRLDPAAAARIVRERLWIYATGSCAVSPRRRPRAIARHNDRQVRRARSLRRLRAIASPDRAPPRVAEFVAGNTLGNVHEIVARVCAKRQRTEGRLTFPTAILAVGRGHVADEHSRRNAFADVAGPETAPVKVRAAFVGDVDQYMRKLRGDGEQPVHVTFLKIKDWRNMAARGDRGVKRSVTHRRLNRKHRLVVIDVVARIERMGIPGRAGAGIISASRPACDRPVIPNLECHHDPAVERRLEEIPQSFLPTRLEAGQIIAAIGQAKPGLKNLFYAPVVHVVIRVIGQTSDEAANVRAVDLPDHLGQPFQLPEEVHLSGPADGRPAMIARGAERKHRRAAPRQIVRVIRPGPNPVRRGLPGSPVFRLSDLCIRPSTAGDDTEGSDSPQRQEDSAGS